MRIQLAHILTLIGVTIGSASASDTVHIEQVEVIGSLGAHNRARQSFRVDSARLSNSAGSSLGDVLRGQTPVVVRDWGRGQRQSISFRGAASTHTSLYWNSMEINSPVIGDTDFSLLPAYAIDKLEVAPGVNSIWYGNGALGGVVAIESRPDWRKKFSIEVIGGLGSFSSYDGMLSIRGGGNRFQSSTKLIYNYSVNDFEFINRDIIDPERPTWHPSMSNSNADYQNSGIVQDFYIRLGTDQTLSVSVMMLDNWRNLPQLTTYEGPQNSHLTHSSDRSARAVVNYSRYGKYLLVEANLGGTMEGNSFSQKNLISGIYKPYIDSRSTGRSLQGNVNLTFGHIRNHTLRTETSALLQSAKSTESVHNTGFDRSRFRFSQGLGWYADWHPIWATSVVVRTGVVGSEWYGTAAMSVDLQAAKWLNLSFKAGYNQHYASLSDLYYTPGGNANLRPEKATTAELGARFGLKGVSVAANIFISVTDDWIVWLPTHAQYWTPTNLRQVLSTGVELQAAYSHSFDSDWSIDLNGTVSFTRTMSIGDPYSANDFSKWEQLPFVPLISGAAQMTATWRNISLAYTVEGESEKSNATNSDRINQTIICPYDIHSVKLSYSPWKFIWLAVECRNFLDSRFYGILRRPMPPRSFMLTAKFRL